jgi:hypothetical protein
MWENKSDAVPYPSLFLAIQLANDFLLPVGWTGHDERVYALDSFIALGGCALLVWCFERAELCQDYISWCVIPTENVAQRVRNFAIDERFGCTDNMYLPSVP